MIKRDTLQFWRVAHGRPHKLLFAEHHKLELVQYVLAWPSSTGGQTAFDVETGDRSSPARPLLPG